MWKKYAAHKDCSLIGAKLAEFYQSEYLHELLDDRFDVLGLFQCILSPLKDLSQIRNASQLGCLLACCNEIVLKGCMDNGESLDEPKLARKMLKIFKNLPGLEDLEKEEASNMENFHFFVCKRSEYYLLCGSYEGFCGNDETEALFYTEAARIFAQFDYLFGEDARKKEYNHSVPDSLMEMKESEKFFDSNNRLRSELTKDQLFEHNTIDLSVYKI